MLLYGLPLALLSTGWVVCRDQAFTFQIRMHGSSELHAVNTTIYRIEGYLRQVGPDGRFPATTDATAAMTTMMGAGGGPEYLDMCRGPDGWPWVWVGDGLPVRPPGKAPVLLLFCPAENPVARGHVHGLFAHPGSSRSGVGKECLDEPELIQAIRIAIAQGESGAIPYSPHAMQVLREQLRKRLEIAGR